MSARSSVSAVVADGLCCGCGACVAVCREDAVAMGEMPAGLLVAKVSAERCTECGTCLRCCPGLGVRVPALPGVDAFAGRVTKAYVAHAAAPEARRRGQSGGLVGSLVGHLFESATITAATGVAFPADGSLRPAARLLRSAGEIEATRGSKYCPAPVASVLGDLAADERVAVVGVACQMHGLRKMIDAGRVDASAIALRIGLLCDRVLEYAAIDRIARDLGVEPTDALGFEYRSKARSGWPGEVCFATRDGRRVYGSQDLRRRIKEYATPPRCRVCFDKMNTTADVSVGDAWHIAESPEGASVALVRTEAGERALAAAQDAGVVRLAEVAPEAVLAAAGLEPLRRRYVAFSDARAAKSRPMPEYERLGPWLGTPGRGERRLARQLTAIGEWVTASPSGDEAVRRIGWARRTHAPVHRALHAASLAARRLRGSSAD